VANLRPALEQGCRKQTPSARKSFFGGNLLFVPDQSVELIEMQVCALLDTREKKTAAQCQIPIFSAGETRFFRKQSLRSGCV